MSQPTSGVSRGSRQPTSGGAGTGGQPIPGLSLLPPDLEPIREGSTPEQIETTLQDWFGWILEKYDRTQQRLQQVSIDSNVHVLKKREWVKFQAEKIKNLRQEREALDSELKVVRWDHQQVTTLTSEVQTEVDKLRTELGGIPPVTDDERRKHLTEIIRHVQKWQLEQLVATNPAISQAHAINEESIKKLHERFDTFDNDYSKMLTSLVARTKKAAADGSAKLLETKINEVKKAAEQAIEQIMTSFQGEMELVAEMVARMPPLLRRLKSLRKQLTRVTADRAELRIRVNGDDQNPGLLSEIADLRDNALKTDRLTEELAGAKKSLSTANEKIRDLQSQADSAPTLQAEVSVLKDNIEAAKKKAEEEATKQKTIVIERDNAQATLKQLQDSVEPEASKVPGLESDVRRLKEEKRSLEDKYKDETAKLSEIIKERDDARTELGNVRQQALTNESTRVSELTAELDTLKDSATLHKRIEERAEKLLKERNELREKYNTVSSELETTKDQLSHSNALAARIPRLETDRNTALQNSNRLPDVERDLVEAKEELKRQVDITLPALRTANEKLQKSNKDLYVEQESNQEKLEKLEGSTANLQRKLDASKKIVEESSTKISDLESNLEEAQRQIGRLKPQADRVSGLEQQVSTSEDGLRSAKHKIDDLESQVTAGVELRKTYRETRTKLFKAENKVEELQNTVDDLSASLADVKVSLATAQRQLPQLQEKSETCQKALDQERQELSTKLVQERQKVEAELSTQHTEAIRVAVEAERERLRNLTLDQETAVATAVQSAVRAETAKLNREMTSKLTTARTQAATAERNKLTTQHSEAQRKAVEAERQRVTDAKDAELDDALMNAATDLAIQHTNDKQRAVLEAHDRFAIVLSRKHQEMVDALAIRSMSSAFMSRLSGRHMEKTFQDLSQARSNLTVCEQNGRAATISHQAAIEAERSSRETAVAEAIETTKQSCDDLHQQVLESLTDMQSFDNENTLAALQGDLHTAETEARSLRSALEASQSASQAMAEMHRQEMSSLSDILEEEHDSEMSVLNHDVLHLRERLNTQEDYTKERSLDLQPWQRSSHFTKMLMHNEKFLWEFTHWAYALGNAVYGPVDKVQVINDTNSDLAVDQALYLDCTRGHQLACWVQKTKDNYWLRIASRHQVRVIRIDGQIWLKFAGDMFLLSNGLNSRVLRWCLALDESR